LNLNGEWDFGVGPERRFDRRIVVPFAPQSRLSGISNWEETDVVWYRRRFEAFRSSRLNSALLTPKMRQRAPGSARLAPNVRIHSRGPD
jgi:hypothetical protein